MCKLLTVKKRLDWIDQRIKRQLLPWLGSCHVRYDYITGHGKPPHPDSLARIRQFNPRAYGWLVEYKALIEEEQTLLEKK